MKCLETYSEKEVLEAIKGCYVLKSRCDIGDLFHCITMDVLEASKQLPSDYQIAAEMLAQGYRLEDIGVWWILSHRGNKKFRNTPITTKTCVNTANYVLFKIARMIMDVLNNDTADGERCEENAIHQTTNY